MTWLSILSGAISIVSALVAYLKNRQVIDQAEAAVVAKGLQEALDAVQKAMAVRRSVRDRIDADPSVLQQPSKDTRPWNADDKD